MKIKVNNEIREVAEGITLLDILTEKQREGVATAVNGRFIPKDSRASTFLLDGDEVTIISAAFGG